MILFHDAFPNTVIFCLFERFLLSDMTLYIGWKGRPMPLPMMKFITLKKKSTKNSKISKRRAKEMPRKSERTPPSEPQKVPPAMVVV